jgi:3-keto-5-aminohexanoate cleavage enzyme
LVGSQRLEKGKLSTMTTPCIITVAITGSLPQKSDNPAVPITVSEQIESTQAAFEAGATLVHAHVRKDDGSPTSDPERFGKLVEGVRKHCPGMVIQLSTGGRSGAGRERGGMIPLKPDMCSLSTGSCNFPTRVYENSPDLVEWLASEMRTYGVKPEIEAFDLSMIFKAVEMQRADKIRGSLHVQFVMGVKNAMPVDREVFEFYITTSASPRTRPGRAPGLVATRSRSIAGRLSLAATVARVLRTMCALTATLLRHLTRRLLSASSKWPALTGANPLP